ncbi:MULTISPECIES: hypothetical protein [Cyanophyceae]|uniref:hypothetical protein n=1 Tax=Cyanophyceae TaxID=3028117 RepID=UPI0016861E65|nr:hypothetical protein [Trichocoleus sp. FACHB-40]MBD2001642.1 hypothetical protein [Trichocoleus sp. FACHB-40]
MPYYRDEQQPLTNAGIAVSDKIHYPSTATMRSHPAAVQPVQSVFCDKCLQQFLAQVAIGLIVLSILLILACAICCNVWLD